MRVLRQKEDEKNERGERIFLSAFPFLLVSWFGFHFPFRTKNKDSSNFKGKFCVAMDEISLHVEDNDNDDDGDGDDDVFYECSLWPGL